MLYGDSAAAYFAYQWAVDDRILPNTLAAGFLVLKMFDGNGYDANSVLDATASIDIRLSEVVSDGTLYSQASVFNYEEGIRDVYVGTEKDPWRKIR